MPLAKIYEIERSSKCGIYCISESPPEEKGKKMFKIGRSIEIKNRLNGYHLCYPNGFYIYFCLLVKKTEFSRKNSDTKKAGVVLTSELETHIFKQLKHIQFENTTRTFHEWFSDIDTAETIKKAFMATHTEHKGLTEAPITEWKDSFYDRYFIDGVEELKITKKRLGITETPPSYMGGEIKKVEDTTVIEGGRATRAGRRTVKPKKFDDYEFFDPKKRVSKNWS